MNGYGWALVAVTFLVALWALIERTNSPSEPAPAPRRRPGQMLVVLHRCRNCPRPIAPGTTYCTWGCAPEIGEWGNRAA
ncbi:hypothetical protein ACFQ61_10250 [Streptomyces sp. NPDC056500]|uniref:hypothetical protein n=1 Tax=Streptomyces sp. NPDC056500 TaxID=3345840 RepID=UPI003683D1DA